MPSHAVGLCHTRSGARLGHRSKPVRLGVVNSKRDTNLRILLASRIYLDARDCDLKFAHPVTRIARADQYRSNVVPQRRPSARAEQVGGFSCFVLRPNARVSLVQRAVVSSLIRFLPVILMIVKEASYPSLERRCLLQITDGTGAVEELPLE